MESADMMAVYARLAERRRGTWGELADVMRVAGRDNDYFKGVA